MTAVVRPRRGISFGSLIVFAGLAAAAGCTSGDTSVPSTAPVVPKCRILKNGVPLKSAAQNLPPGDSGFRLLFIRMGAVDTSKPISAIVSTGEPGTFELLGQDGRAIPPGKYRIAIELGREGGKDELNGKFSPENSPIEVDVKEGEDLVIELGKYQ